jgi:hypothetical protein
VPNFQPDKPYDFYRDGKWRPSNTLTVDGRRPPESIDEGGSRGAFVAAEQASGLGFGLTVLTALAALCLFRGLGWVIAGFTKA